MGPCPPPGEAPWPGQATGLLSPSRGRAVVLSGQLTGLGGGEPGSTNGFFLSRAKQATLLGNSDFQAPCDQPAPRSLRPEPLDAGGAPLACAYRRRRPRRRCPAPPPGRCPCRTWSPRGRASCCGNTDPSAAGPRLSSVSSPWLGGSGTKPGEGQRVSGRGARGAGREAAGAGARGADLHHAHVQAGLGRELLAHVARGLGRRVVRALESLQLLGRDGRARPLGRGLGLCAAEEP